MSLNLRALGVLVLGTAILYLAGAYFGGLFLALFWLAILLTVASLGLLGVWYATTRYIQNFSTLRPVKGEDVQYGLTVGNESIFPLVDVGLRFTSAGPGVSSFLPPANLYVPAGEAVKKHYVIRCPYRGAYTIGLETIELRDLFGIARLRPKATAETFYVYPRVLELKDFTTGTDSHESTTEGDATGGVADYTLFNQLREYRAGESIRHMAWRKYAATGKPYLKQFDSTALPDVRLYVDLRRSTIEGAPRYEQEDSVIETLVALVRYYLTRGTSILVCAPTEPAFQFGADSPEHFAEFYDSTVQLEFRQTVSPAVLYRSDRAGGLVATKSVVIITHILDPDVFSLAEEYLEVDRSISVIYSHVGNDAAFRAKTEEYITRLRRKGADIIEIRSTTSIIEDLERKRRVRSTQ